MSAFGLFARRVRSLFARRDVDARLDEEMQFHIESATARNIRAGMTPAEARSAARREFGSVGLARDNARDAFRFTWLEDFWRDFTVGARGLRRNPAFAAATLITLALGIGAATAMFSVVNGVFLKSLPYPAADRIVRLYQLDGDGNRMSVSDANFDDWKASSRQFAAMAEMQVLGATPVVAGEEPHLARLSNVSDGFFEVMGVEPALGRVFTPAEHAEGAPPRAVVSDAYWRTRLGGGTSLGNHEIRVGPALFTVVGVMPPGFAYPSNADIWAPAELQRAPVSRTAHNYAVIARIANGVELTAAQRELSGISRALKERHGDATWMADAAVIPLRDQLTANAKPAVTLLSVSSLLLLVIACANVSSLLLARAAGRDRELAVRLTIGAGRWRVSRQLLAETLLLCLIGAGLGVLLARGGVGLLLGMQPSNLPRLAEISVDVRVLLFAIGVATLAAITLGLITALRVSESRLSSSLMGSSRTSAGGRTGARARKTLVVAQVALTLMLLSGAGLLVRSFERVLSIDPGYSTDDALVLDIVAPPGDRDMARRVGFQRELIARLSALPGVTHAALINDFPLGGFWYPNGQFIEMLTPTEITTPDAFAKFRADKSRIGQSGFRVAGRGYFEAMNIPLIEGRTFDASDSPDADVQAAVISRSLAETQWPGKPVLGRLIQFGNMDGDVRALRVVGVVEDVREFGLEAQPGPLLYALNEQRPVSAGSFSVVVRGPAPSSISIAAQRIARELAPDMPVRVRTVSAALDLALSGRRFNLFVIATFAGVALVLATIGVYGLVANFAQQRQREFGIRAALGARSSQIARLVAGESVVLALTGIGLGLAGALWLTRLMQQLLFGVTPTDPLSFVLVAATMLVAVLVAAYFPARRAMRLAPVTSLRSE